VAQTPEPVPISTKWWPVGMCWMRVGIKAMLQGIPSFVTDSRHGHSQKNDRMHQSKQTKHTN
jgi:hypothetical protein